MEEMSATRNLAEDIMNRKIRTARQLAERLAAGDDPNKPDCDVPELSMTPLSAAARNLDDECVRLLLEAGADHRPRRQSGDTALHWAAIGQITPAAARVLVEAGADLEARNDEGQTPLHYAAAFSKGTDCRVVAGLLELGADPRALDAKGRTPARTSETAEARILLERAAEAAALREAMAEPTAPPRNRRRMSSDS